MYVCDNPTHTGTHQGHPYRLDRFGTLYSSPTYIERLDGGEQVEEERPTGITRQDMGGRGRVEFEGQRAQIIGLREYYEAGGATHVLELHAIEGDPRTSLELHGYFNRDGEFMEVYRER
jgi:hypothetical protein